MDLDFEKLASYPVFNGVKARELSAMLSCLGACAAHYPKKDFIQLSGGDTERVGIVADGVVQMIKEGADGGQSILSVLNCGSVFGESFVCSGRSLLSVSFYAANDCAVLWLPFKKVLCSCAQSCAFHHQLIENMMRLLAEENIRLIEKLDITSRKTIRERVLAYLHQHNDGGYFESPLGRLELADYLCVDRSALTRELSHMKNEGLIDYDKNTFRIL